MASIFHGQKFFLTRTLSSNVAFRLRCLIEEHGGIVSSSPAGATELVDYDKLDSRRPDWISADFIDDSVASGILQDPAKYSGVVFSLTSSKAHQNGRVQYSVEDDARLLHFAKLRGWESIKSVPASTWKLAESNRVTEHSWQSMHEHFRKKLQKKTPAEQRIIMARASEIIRGNLLNSFPDEEEKKEETATTPSPPTEDQFLFETSTPSSTRSPSAREATPATRSPPVHFVSGGKKRLKRKRESDADSDEIAESSETEKKCGEANADEFGGARVVFFKSAWAEFAADPSKKAILQSLFYTAVVDGSSQSISSDNLQASTENAPERGGRSNLDCQHSLETEEQHATEAEIDATLCQLEFETEQDMPIIVYALYYCSGNIAMARAFLKGASPSGMWSPEDDSLLANLMVDGNIDRSIVEAAAVNGSFASMQKVRDTEAILYRLRFLRNTFSRPHAAGQDMDMLPQVLTELSEAISTTRKHSDEEPKAAQMNQESHAARRSGDMQDVVSSRGTSIGDDDEPTDISPSVYKFDVAHYKDGSFRFVPACAQDLIKYTGRLLHHGAQSSRKTKINTVQFDWPAVAFQISVQGSRSVAIRLKGDGNYFNVFVNGKLRCILRASLNATCCDVATDLDVQQHYTIRICKRTEPQMRGAMSTFKVCTFYGFIVEEKSELFLLNQPRLLLPVRRIEFIGDSDTCGFGNEGKASSAKNLFGMKGRMENVYNGYACITARMFDAEEHVLAWSGKGVHSNSADWGPNMPALWKNTIASRPGDWDVSSWIPDVVVINLGVNDLSPPASAETDLIAGYTSFLLDVRSCRPNAHIFCVVYDKGCLSLANSNFVSLQLQEIVKVAISKVSKHDNNVHYTFIKVEEGLKKEDFASMMHYAVSGHIKIAKLLAEEIALRTGWSIDHEPLTMPYPQAKDRILMPRDHLRPSCTMT